MQPILYGSVISPFVRKVIIALSVKKIPFQSIELIPFIDDHRAKLLKMNPFGKVPVLQDGDLQISDSSVICAYLEKKYPNNPIYPANPECYAKCMWYEEYADNKLIPTLAFVFFHTKLATKFNRTPDTNGIQHALEHTIPEIFDYLDAEIGNKQYLVANHFSLADISIASAFLNFDFAGYNVDPAVWKNLSRYINSLSHQRYIADAFQLAVDRLQIKT